MKQRIAQLLVVTPEQLQRAWPFFVVYLLLFAALTMADAVAVSLFASRVGAASLPKWYAITAVCSLGLISFYLIHATRTNSGRLFDVILGGIIAAWSAAWVGQWIVPGPWPLGLLFVSREIALTMVLMHFGTFLQDYFLRSELNRILPVIYAGGRVGGIVAGALVSGLASPVGTANLLLVSISLVVGAWLSIHWISRHRAHCGEEPSGQGADGTRLADGADAAQSDTNIATGTSVEPKTIRQRIVGFLTQVVNVPLLRWLTLTTLFFVACRWWLVYQYTAAFETGFVDEDALAQYLGMYTQIALGLSLFLQLFLVVRLVMWQGVAKTHWLYSFLVCGALLGNVFLTGIPMATFSRFIEAELRFGLRNPVSQMLINRFEKKMRIAVRGWSMGWLIPVGTLVVSATISLLLSIEQQGLIPVVGVFVGIGYLVTAWNLGPAYQRFDKLDDKRNGSTETERATS